jgi:hypothetical protein
MDAEAWIALAGGTAGGGAIGTGVTACFNYLRDRQKQQSVDRHDATQQATDDRQEFTGLLIKRLETVEEAIKDCHDQHAECQRDRLADAVKVGHLEGQVATLTALVKQQVAPQISIHSGERVIETIGIEPPPDNQG